METTTQLNLCPTDADLANYKDVKGISRDEMTADQIWVDFHVAECEECAAKIE